MRGTQVTWGIFIRIPGNVIILTYRGMFRKIPGNVWVDSGEYSRRFRGMFEKILNNVLKDSGEYSRLFPGMFKKIPVNVRKDSRECYQRFRGMFKRNLDLGNLNLDYLFHEILLVFIRFYYQTAKNQCKKSYYWAILLKETFSTLLIYS